MAEHQKPIEIKSKNSRQKQKTTNKQDLRSKRHNQNDISNSDAQAAEAIFAGVIQILVPSFGFNWARDASFFISSF